MFGWRIALWVILVISALYFIYLVRSTAAVFGLAFIVAAILEPLVRKLYLKGLSWRLSVLVVWLTGVGIAILLSIWLVPVVSRQLVTFRDTTEEITRRVARQTAQDNYFVRWNPRYIVTNDPTIQEIDRFFQNQEPMLRQLGLPTNRRQAVNQYIEPFRQSASSQASNFFSNAMKTLTSVGSNLMIWGFIPVIVLFILQDMQKFKERASSLIPPSIRSETVEIISDVSNVFVGYLRGMSIVLIYYLVIASITLTLLGAPYSLLLAALFTAIYLIPIVGGVINCLLLLFLTGSSGKNWNIFFTIENPWIFGLVIALIYAFIFTFFDPIITNRVVGKAVGLSPVLSFFVVFSFGALFGPVGMVFAFPIAGAAKIIIDRLLEVTSKSQDLQLPAIPTRHRT